MARYLFGSDLILTTQTPPTVWLAANAPFTLWSDRAGGDQYTDCTAPDGVTPLPLDGFAHFLADGSGQRPALRGPDGVVAMWVDTGSSTRYPIVAVDLMHDVLVAAIGWLAGNFPGAGSGGTGGGLPTGTTLDAISNGVDRLAMTGAERTKLANTPTTFLALGTTATTAKAGSYAPTAKDVGAVTSVNGDVRLWTKRTTTQGPPTEAEGAVRVTDYCFLDVVT